MDDKNNNDNRIFYYHYDKPNSELAGKPRISIKYKGECYNVSNVICDVPTAGYIRNKQPHYVIRGRVDSDKFHIINDVCYIGATSVPKKLTHPESKSNLPIKLIGFASILLLGLKFININIEE